MGLFKKEKGANYFLLKLTAIDKGGQNIFDRGASLVSVPIPHRFCYLPSVVNHSLVEDDLSVSKVDLLNS